MNIEILDTDLLVLAFSNLLLQLDDLLGEQPSNESLRDLFDKVYEEFENIQKQVDLNTTIQKPRWNGNNKI